MSGSIKKKIETLERKLNECHNVFVVSLFASFLLFWLKDLCTTKTEMMSTQSTMLVGIRKDVGDIPGRISRNQVIDQRTIMWKLPGVGGTFC